MRILITGSNGQIGGELAQLYSRSDHEVSATDRLTMDLTNRADVEATIDGFRPDVVVNCAAFTGVDLAEDEAETAFAVNDTAVRDLCRAVDALGSCLVHLSTDYVFDGLDDGWYREEARTNPQGIYGQSKLAGEAHVLSSDRGIVLRTAWVYSTRGANFVKTIRRLAIERDEIDVVSDQLGCPTAAKDIAAAVAEIIDSGCGKSGLFNMAAPDQASWYELAVATVQNMGRGDEVKVHPITTDQYPTKAFRPSNSRLDSGKLASDYGIVLPSWRKSLGEVSTELNILLDRSRRRDR